VTGRADGDEELAPAPIGADPPGAVTPGSTDDAAAALAREVYWAGDGVSRLPGDARSLRERLEAFAHQLRVEQGEPVPVGETFLGSAAGWKRGVKRFVWRLTRFSTMRYDRLLADLAEMNAELARRLLEMEEEVARLHQELDHRDGERS
jgi:hypothetical protein